MERYSPKKGEQVAYFCCTDTYIYGDLRESCLLYANNKTNNYCAFHFFLIAFMNFSTLFANAFDLPGLVGGMY